MRFDEPVNLVQQPRQPLHFVDDDPGLGREMPDGLREERRVDQQVLIQALVEEVEVHGAGKRGARPGAFSDAAHPEQEEALSRRLGQVPVDGHDAVINP